MKNAWRASKMKAPAGTSALMDEDIDPALAHAIEETILFGKKADMEALIDDISDDARIPNELRQDLESLHYFRLHYTEELPGLSDEARQKIIRYDADWTMRLIRKMHQRHFGVVEQKQA